MNSFNRCFLSLFLSLFFVTLSLAQFSGAGSDYRPGGAYINLPEGGPTTLRYDDGINFNSIGLTAAGTFEYAARFTASMVGPLTGQVLKQVITYIADPATFNLKVYDAGTATSAGALLYTQSFTPVIDAWNTIDLTTPVSISGNDIWVSVEVTHAAGVFPAGVDDGPAVVDGDWLFNAGSWVRLSVVAPTLNYNWNLAAVIDEIVPVELTSFTASINPLGMPVLNWVTASEINNRGFEVEKRTVEGQFVTVGFVEGYGTTTEEQSYTYVDKSVNPGTYYYRLKQVDFDGKFEYSQEVELDITPPLTFSLDQNYPNPFNPNTNIKFSLKEAGYVKLAVYNTLGEEINVLINGQSEAGFFEVNFDASNLSSGTYIYRLETPGFVTAKKMLLMK